MWCVVHKGYVYNKIQTVDEVVNLVFRLTDDWEFAKYLRGHLPSKKVGWEKVVLGEDFGEQIYIWKCR